MFFALHSYYIYNVKSSMSVIDIMLSHLLKDVKYKEQLSKRMRIVLSNMLCKEIDKRIDSKGLYDYLNNTKTLEELECKALKVFTHNLNSSTELLEQLSRENILIAKYLYALSLEKKKEYAHAMGLYLELAKLKFIRAMNRLAFLYEGGEGVKQNYRLSAYWYFQAGKLGSPVAIYKMGKIFNMQKVLKEI